MVVLKSDYSSCPLKKRPLTLPSEPSDVHVLQQREPEDLSVNCRLAAPMAPHTDAHCHTLTAGIRPLHRRSPNPLPNQECSPNAVPRLAHSPSSLPHQAHSPRSLSRQAHSPNTLPHEAHSPNTLPHEAHSPNTLPRQAHSPNTLPHEAHSPNTLPRQAHSPNTLPRQAHSPSSLPRQAHSPISLPCQAQSPNTLPRQAHSPSSLPCQAHSPNTLPHEAHSSITLLHKTRSPYIKPRHADSPITLPHPAHSNHTLKHLSDNHAHNGRSSDMHIERGQSPDMQAVSRLSPDAHAQSRYSHDRHTPSKYSSPPPIHNRHRISTVPQQRHELTYRKLPVVDFPLASLAEEELSHAIELERERLVQRDSHRSELHKNNSRIIIHEQSQVGPGINLHLPTSERHHYTMSRESGMQYIELKTPVIRTHSTEPQISPISLPYSDKCFKQNTEIDKPGWDLKSPMHAYYPVPQCIDESGKRISEEQINKKQKHVLDSHSPRTVEESSKEIASSTFKHQRYIIPKHQTGPWKDPLSFVMQTSPLGHVRSIPLEDGNSSHNQLSSVPSFQGPLLMSNSQLASSGVDKALMRQPSLKQQQLVPLAFGNAPVHSHPHRPWLTDDPPKQKLVNSIQPRIPHHLPSASGHWVGGLPLTWPLNPLPQATLLPPSHVRECRSPGSDSTSSDESNGRGEAWYSCADCNKSFSTYSGFIKHKQFHCAALETKSDSASSDGNNGHGEARYACADCSKSYSTYSGLSKHKQFHCAALEGKSLVCKHCKKVYTSLGALKMHIRTHTLPCKCQLCGKAFSRPWLLQGHIRTHTGEKPFQCPQCDRCFADRSNLRAHLQTHAHVKKYACSTCHKTFSRMSLLNKHSEAACPALHRPAQPTDS